MIPNLVKTQQLAEQIRETNVGELCLITKPRAEALANFSQHKMLAHVEKAARTSHPINQELIKCDDSEQHTESALLFLKLEFNLEGLAHLKVSRDARDSGPNACLLSRE